MKQRITSSRFFLSLLIGIGLTLLLSAIEIGILWIFNPFHVLGTAPTQHPSVLIALLTHIPLLLLVPLIEVSGGTLIALLSMRPLALRAYLREVQKANEHYCKLYTPLHTLTNIYATPVAYYHTTPGPRLDKQAQNVAILDVLEQQDAHLVLIGEAGAGKTIALRAYQCITSQHGWARVRSRRSIPVYVPLQDYSLFLKMHQQAHPVTPGQEDFEEQDANAIEMIPQETLLDFLLASDLPGMHHIEPYLKKLMEQDRVTFLCDGLDEVDRNYRASVTKELAHLMLITQNRVVITSSEGEYREDHRLIELENGGHLAVATISPLQSEQVREFVERYVEEQGASWQHTAGQIMQVVNQSRFRYLCTNPMMLFTLLETVDKVGVERGKQLDTRGRLLRKYVAQVLERTQKQAGRSKEDLGANNVVQLLSRIACAARWSNEDNVIQLRISTEAAGHIRTGFYSEEVCDAVLVWLDEHLAHGPFEAEKLDKPYDRHTITPLLQLAHDAALIDIRPEGVLSFRHELIASYFVAEYFVAHDEDKAISLTPIAEQFLTNAAYWSESVALWAGLLDTPAVLAERFTVLGRSNPAYALQALALSLVCISVAWIPPQADIQSGNLLPPLVADSLITVMRNRAAREEFARIFTRCAEACGQEIYRSLLPLVMVEGIDELLLLLDATIIPELLFTQLCDTVDTVAYDTQVKRLCRVLGQLGGIAVIRAATLSQPAPMRSMRLRAAAINILGGTQHVSAVDPLLARLSDTEPFIVDRAINALMRLGPELSLTGVAQELENRNLGPLTRRIHKAALTILEHFLTEENVQRQLTAPQHQRVLERLLSLLSSSYASEPDVQQQARAILVRQGQNVEVVGAQGVVGASPTTTSLPLLIRALSTKDDMLARNVMQTVQEIGSVATPNLLEVLNQQPSEIVRMRIVAVLTVVRDVQALPHILRLVGDPSFLVQQQVMSALDAYKPESISGLIDLVLFSPDELIIEKAANILGSIGEEVVVPMTQAISTLVPVVGQQRTSISGEIALPKRIRLLVQVLERVQDVRAIPVLISLLQTPQADSLLTITVIRALSQFQNKQVVPPLIDMLTSSQAHIYEEAIDALSSLGDIALDGLIAALDVMPETSATPRIRRAVLGMIPFPGEQLLTALGQHKTGQVQQISMLLRMQGADAAQVLVKHLFDADVRVRGYVRQTLSEMSGPIVVPALLEMLNRPQWRSVLAEFLLKYAEAISPLVTLLGDSERGEVAAAILPQFGAEILPSLISGLDDLRLIAQEYAQGIIVALVRQNREVVARVVQLFSLSLPLRAHEALLEVLTNELADVSVPALLDGLADAHLIDDVSEALVRLARKRNWQRQVLHGLLESLRIQERRRGAETALIKIGGLAVQDVGALITDADQAVANTAQHILREIGVPALYFIWAAHGDTSNQARHDAAMDVFHSMPTEVIKDALVELLASDQPDNISMALALLLERIHDESTLPLANQEMIPTLLDYVQIHGGVRVGLRIVALLLLLGGSSVVNHIMQVLYDQPDYPEQLVHALLLLGNEAQERLAKLISDSNAPSRLRAESMGMLGMMAATPQVYDYAQSLSKYGLSAQRLGLLHPDQLALALRALGSLLTSGRWDVATIQELRRTSREGSAQHELYNVLLGWRYEPYIADLESNLQNERASHTREIRALTARIVTDQEHISTLETEVEQVRHEHGVRGDELYQATQEREAFRSRLDRAVQEKQALQDENAQLQAYNVQLLQEIKFLRESEDR